MQTLRFRPSAPRPFLDLCLLAGLGLLVPAVPAQAGPGVITGFANDGVFNSSYLAGQNVYDSNGSNRSVVQINLTKSSPNDTAGKWTAALTVYDLATTYGGSAGGQYVIMGQYDTTGTTPTFTPSTLANNMNNTSKSPCFGLMIEGRDGLYAAVDWNDGPHMSYRQDNKSAFAVPVKITAASGATPLPTASYLDPSLGYVDNKLKLFYIDRATNIMMQDITPTISNNVLTKADVQGQAVAVANMSIMPHSPTPIIDKNGEVRGLWLAGLSGSDSDMFFMPSLNTLDAPIKVFDNTAWMNNGGVAGGRLFFANTAVGTSASVGEVAWLLGSNTVINGTATMTLGCRNPKTTTGPVVSRVALSLNLNTGTATPIPIPGWNGGYALSGNILIFATMIGLGQDELAHWSQAVPNDPTLKGIRVAVQGLAAPQGVNPTLTNTTILEFR